MCQLPPITNITILSPFRYFASHDMIGQAEMTLYSGDRVCKVWSKMGQPCYFCFSTKEENTMQIIDDGRCLVCGPHNPIGFQATFERDPSQRRATTTVRIPETFQGWQGITHGGIISALLDETCAQACMASGIDMVTSELRLRFKAPVPTSATVVVTGEVVGERRRLIDVRGRLECEGKVMAEAEAIMYRTGVKAAV